MKLKDLKQEFIKQLSPLYPQEEVESFFVILSDFILKFSRLDISLNRELAVSEEHIRAFHLAIARLSDYEPVQYITGETEFYSLPFSVTKNTLIPRPETEELVNWIISEFNVQHSKLKILDIGTGSGCIAVSLAKHLVGAEITAVDISEEALKIARKNASLNEVNVHFLQTDILKTTALPEQYHIIVSNPPYVRELEKKMMQPNVLEHEPAGALFVEDTDPLLFYRTIAQLASRHLTIGGSLFFEINEYLGEETNILLRSIGFSQIEIKKDIFGKDRMIKCIKNG